MIPGLGRSPGEGNSNPLQYPCLENLMGRGAWWAAVHGVAKSRAQLSNWQTGDRRVRPRLGLRHGTPLASRGVPGERGHLSSCIWNLGFFSGRGTGESMPLRVDFIHRVEFGEVSGHRVLIKRGPGNRGPTECGTTHEATSGMSS